MVEQPVIQNQRKMRNQKAFKAHLSPAFMPMSSQRCPPVRRNIGSLAKNNEYSAPFEKQLQENDIQQHYRLFLSQKAVRKFLFPLLKEEELRGFVRQGIPVMAYDVQGNAFPMEFKQTSCKNKYHILTRGWAEFCDEHGLRAFKDFVTLWMFRHKEINGQALLCHLLKNS